MLNAEECAEIRWLIKRITIKAMTVLKESAEVERLITDIKSQCSL